MDEGHGLPWLLEKQVLSSRMIISSIAIQNGIWKLEPLHLYFIVLTHA